MIKFYIADDMPYGIEAEMPPKMDVIVTDDAPEETGLLDADGRKLYRKSERQPIGFVKR